MGGIKDQENIEEVRRRLYDRGADLRTNRHTINNKTIDVSRDWVTTDTTDKPTENAPNSSRRYRKIILFGSLFIFALVALVSGAVLYMGGNQISGENIDVIIDGPNSIRGGDTVDLQIAVTNNNAVSIDSAVLIINYPEGVRGVGEEPSSTYEKRVTIGEITSEETRNIPLELLVYGEQGDIKEIEATVEYRLAGSNSLFRKDSEPLRFEIVSSPLQINLTAVEKVASGQTVNVEIEVISNVEYDLENLLITAVYPEGFQFSSAQPSPDFNQNVWQIDRLQPEESATITVAGTIQGLTREAMRLRVNAGPARQDNQFILDTPLNEAYTEFVIEQPFISVNMSVDGDADGSVVLAAREDADVEVLIQNTLSESVYDVVIEVIPGGTALGRNSISSNQGFYDSNSGVLRFDSTTSNDLSQLLPGATRRVDFTISPTTSVGTTAFDVVVNAYARRVAESNAQEQLIGTTKLEARYSSNVGITNSVERMSGPVPPVVGESTRYLVSLTAEAGSNNVTNAEVTASLPSYVTWLDEQTAGGNLSYNPTNKTLTWQAGNINSGQQKKLTFAVEIVPSSSQQSTVPTLVTSQSIQATDRFTGTQLRANAAKVTTELPSDSGFDEGNGRVQSN